MLVCVSGVAQERGRLRPVEPTAAILEAFQTHQVVALSEGGHGNEQSHAFRLALIRDPRFAATVDDIVVEFGNSLYQDTMDRYVQGADIPDDELRGGADWR
jgi:erythromycin esterase-like protein|tara:strand:+ start:4116 stop:4418 length:303 start_codon:yes stop_codon:yes gene_type:complete